MKESFNPNGSIQKTVCSSFNSKVVPRSFQVKDLVLCDYAKQSQQRMSARLLPSVKGPFKVILKLSKGAYYLKDTKGRPLNSRGMLSIYRYIIVKLNRVPSQYICLSCIVASFIFMSPRLFLATQVVFSLANSSQHHILIFYYAFQSILWCRNI